MALFRGIECSGLTRRIVGEGAQAHELVDLEACTCSRENTHRCLPETLDESHARLRTGRTIRMRPVQAAPTALHQS